MNSVATVTIGSWSIPTSLLTFILGLIVGVLGHMFKQFTFSKKEGRDERQKLYENATELLDKEVETYNRFVAALTSFLQKKGKPTLGDISNLMITGETHFQSLQRIAAAILDGRVSPRTRDGALVHKISEALNSSIPKYYSALQETAQRNGLPYEGKFERSNYANLILVVEKYGCKDQSANVEVSNIVD